MALITIDDIYTYLQQTYNPSAELEIDSLYDFLIDAVSVWIENVCNRTFNSTVYSTDLDGTGTAVMVLPQYPIISLSDISIGNDYDGWVAFSNAAMSQVRIKYTEGELYYAGGFNEGWSNIKVGYIAGYETIPEDLKLLCIQIIVDLANQSEKDGTLESEKQGDYSYKIATVVEKSNKYQKVINLYRNVV